MKFSALVGEMRWIVHAKFQLSVTLSAVEIKLERKQGLFYAPEEVLCSCYVHLTHTPLSIGLCGTVNPPSGVDGV